MKSFDEACREAGSDKWLCGYGPLYEAYVFTRVLRTEPVRILELGVHNGASMRLWEELYPQAQIVGLDIEPRCIEYTSERTRIVIGNQTNEALLRGLGSFDLVVDDCSHEVGDMTRSFEILWSATNNVYVIEDCHSEHLGRVVATIEATGDAEVIVCASSFPKRHIVFARRLLS